MNSFILTFSILSVLFFLFLILYIYENKYFKKQFDRGLMNIRCPENETAFIKRRVTDDWNNDKVLYPEKYIEYFKYDLSALMDYQSCLIWDIQNKCGYLPDYITNDYNRYTYNPYVFFIKKNKYKLINYHESKRA